MAVIGKKELAAAISEKHGLNKALAGEILDTLEERAKAWLCNGDDVRVIGLILSCEESAARMGRNPATSEPMQIEAKKRLKCKAGKALKDALNA